VDENAYSIILKALFKCIGNNGHIYVIGNGGSAATASHFVNDLTKLVWDQTEVEVNVRCLSDNVPLITALANDIAYDEIFAWQLARCFTCDDVLIAFSGSGNSPNIIKAIEVANEVFSALTIGIGGRDGGEMCRTTDYSLIVSDNSMQIIEDVHLAISHSLCTDIIGVIKGL
jgi:D-sedoheptulose 7-phosphate isomerase